jgi:hypothetical protein
VALDEAKNNTQGSTENPLEAFTAWQAAWQELPQERIQQWIERIP